MPHTRGDEVLHALREKYSALELPVIMVTSRSESADVVTFLHLGANDYIVKPIDFEIAIMRINTQLKLRELHREAARVKELEAVSAMITTYNHELNNPLAIALGSLKNISTTYPKDQEMLRLDKALWRIADIVKSISEVTATKTVDFEPYNRTKMVKIK
jgi:DNA-binding response OmpR family regulator